jgi:anti-sigma regulatory factor (Ser/Thr protein kinase)
MEVSVAASPSSLSRLRRAVQERLQAEAQVPCELVDAVVLAVSEATTNAILYGSSGSQPVTVTVQVDGGWIEATIRDWGRAADAIPRTVPDQSLGGRGLWLITQLADEVRLAKAHPGTLIALRWCIGAKPNAR